MEVNNARFDENADESSTDASQKSEDYKKLLEYGIHESVADRLEEIYKSGKADYIFIYSVEVPKAAIRIKKKSTLIVIRQYILMQSISISGKFCSYDKNPSHIYYSVL